jgi:predicted RNase H-like HicB family nuclease
MKTFYIAGIVPESAESGGGYSVYFPDVPNVAAGGESIEEAINNATEGLYIALRGLAEQNAAMPSPSSLPKARAKVRAERQADGLPCPADVLYQYIPAPAVEMTPVRVNVTIPKSSLEEIDAKARLYGFTRSAFLTHAALEYRAE